MRIAIVSWLVVSTLGAACSTVGLSDEQVLPGRVVSPRPVTVTQMPRPRPITRPKPVQCAAPSSVAGDTLPRLGKAWKSLYAWLVKKKYHRRAYANSRQFTRRVGDAIAARLRRASNWNRPRAARLAMMFLSLRARTVNGTGSKWDCTTRMFQLTAQARRLAGINRISYTGSRGRRIVTISGANVFNGYRVKGKVLTLMWVDHYRQRRLSRRLMSWKTPLLKEGGIWNPAVYRRLQVGDILFWPRYGPGHFGEVMYKSRDFFLALEGYPGGAPTIITIYLRKATTPDRCVAAELANLPGFNEIARLKGQRVVLARNVHSETILSKGETRVGAHK